MRKIGFTTSIPIEVVFAADLRPVDLNNTFITHPDRNGLVLEAEKAGFPPPMCGWIKGIYGAVRAMGIEEVIAVVQGDCSNTHALMEVLEMERVRVFPFSFPYDRDREFLRFQIEKLMRQFDVSSAEVRAVKARLDEVREKVHRIDELTWTKGVVSGFENHLYLVSTSDMEGDVERFEAKVDRFLDEIAARPQRHDPVRLGFVGVPPIFDDLYPFVEERGARVVFNEVQRQFSMPYNEDDMVAQYLRYTYPYDIFTRIEDISLEAERRRIDGLIHYVQSFCFRQIEDLILRRRLELPILTIEGDRPQPLDARTRVRLEAFIESLG